MAKCDICSKEITFGIKVSHSHRRTNRTWKPNVKRVKAIVDCHGHYQNINRLFSIEEWEEAKKQGYFMA